MGKVDVSAKGYHGPRKKTPFQLESLEEFYLEDKYPNQDRLEDYAKAINLTRHQVRFWFKDRRRKDRRNGVSDSVESELGQSREGPCFPNTRKECNKRTSSHSRIVTKGFSSTHLGDRVNHLMNQNGQRKKHKDLSGNCMMREMDFTENQPSSLGLLSKEYILKKIFRKDGPALGAEFDSLPKKAFGYFTVSRDDRFSWNSERTKKRRKILESEALNSDMVEETNLPPRKYGMGKGLMTVWHATQLNHKKATTCANFLDKRAIPLPSKSGSSRMTRRSQQLKSVQNVSSSNGNMQGKGSHPVRKVSSRKDVDLKSQHLLECKLSSCESSEQSSQLTLLVDDEELELRELEAGSNPLRCSGHLAANGAHDYGCPLCKDLLARFPPQSVKMRKLFCTRPWDSSTELVKKLFKVLQFLYSHSETIHICTFTLDEFAQAFHDKDSMLLGQMHEILLKQLLLDVESGKAAGFVPRTSKSCRFLGLLKFVKEQELDVNLWIDCLNPLTWTEILRQILVAAGFSTKQKETNKNDLNKERNQMAKYGLHPRTLKGELFSMLSKEGSAGLKVPEMARLCQTLELDLPGTLAEQEVVIISTLSSDITLFEKIGPAAYRLRVDPQIKGKRDSQSDSDDSGSVHDDSDDSMSCSGYESDGSEKLYSALSDGRITNNKNQHKKTSQNFTEVLEIDESFSGNAWVLGLVEGDYSKLSIDEKLDVLIALVDLVDAGSSLRVEEPQQVISASQNRSYPGSGAKIKRSVKVNLTLLEPSPETDKAKNNYLDTSSSASSEALNNGKASIIRFQSDTGGTNSPVPGEEAGQYVHPMQPVFLGSDRRYNNYWLFLGPCTANDPGHRRIYFESSEDGHWEVIDSPQAFHALLSILDPRGIREARLFASLEKRGASLCQAMEEHAVAKIDGRQETGFDLSQVEGISGDGSPPISDIDNMLSDTSNVMSSATGAIEIDLGTTSEEKKRKWDRLQAFDKWIWKFFYSNLNSVKYNKKSFMESLARCESCHDLYWRDEKHCKICHITLEIDFDLDERYAIHVATCREIDNTDFPKHKVLPSQLQALKAAIYAIEASFPEAALTGTWRRSALKLWVKRLRRTTSLPELLQVLPDFVGAINQDWLSTGMGSNAAVEEIIMHFQTMPQTTSSVALWMTTLDNLLASYQKPAQSGRLLT